MKLDADGLGGHDIWFDFVWGVNTILIQNLQTDPDKLLVATYIDPCCFQVLMSSQSIRSNLMVYMIYL